MEMKNKLVEYGLGANTIYLVVFPTPFSFWGLCSWSELSLKYPNTSAHHSISVCQLGAIFPLSKHFTWILFRGLKKPNLTAFHKRKAKHREKSKNISRILSKRIYFLIYNPGDRGWRWFNFSQLDAVAHFVTMATTETTLRETTQELFLLVSGLIILSGPITNVYDIG